MCIDTPIFDPVPRGFVFQRAASFDIRDRKARSEAFRDYLERVWHSSSFDMNYLDFPAVLAGQQDSFLSVARHLERGRTRQSSHA
jgi:hypothetical protein